MEISDERIDGATVLKLRGHFDAYQAPAVEQLFRRAVTASVPYMIVDLTDVDFIDSTGLATLVIGMKLCRQYDGEFSLCGMHAPVHTIFELTRLDRVFMIAATREKAIASIHERQRG